jgi:subtilisin family serine protease
MNRPLRDRVTMTLIVSLVCLSVVQSPAGADDQVPRVSAETPGDVDRGSLLPPDAPQVTDTDAVDQLERELSASGGDYDGFVIVLNEATAWEEFRSVVTRFRRVDVQTRAQGIVEAAGGRVADRYPMLNQQHVRIDADGARRLARDRSVQIVSPNVRVSVDVRRSQVQAASRLRSVGLGMVDASGTADLLNDSYRWTGDGAGVEVYVFDTGIQADHPDFAGRIPVEPASGWFRISPQETPEVDCNGHGTHVAGTVGGTISGVAKGATLIPVKVFPTCERGGLVSDIVAGIAWLRSQYPTGQVDRPIVANMSLGASANSALDAAVLALVEDGVHVVVAAGNSGAPAANFSPARIAEVLTVGATGFVSDGNVFVLIEAEFSNYGPEIDLFALGRLVNSSCSSAIEGDPCTEVVLDGITYPLQVLAGTSMAAPHVAGVVARLIGSRFTADGTLMTPAEAHAAVVSGGLGIVVLLDLAPGVPAPAEWSRTLASSRFLEPPGPDSIPTPAVVACSGARTGVAVQLPERGVAPLTWQVTGGSDPGMLTLSADGRVTSTVTAGDASATAIVRVTDAFGRFHERTFRRFELPAGCN